MSSLMLSDEEEEEVKISNGEGFFIKSVAVKSGVENNAQKHATR